MGHRLPLVSVPLALRVSVSLYMFYFGSSSFSRNGGIYTGRPFQKLTCQTRCLIHALRTAESYRPQTSLKKKRPAHSGPLTLKPANKNNVSTLWHFLV